MPIPDDKTLLDLIQAGKINLTNIRQNLDKSWSWFNQSLGPPHNRWEPAPGGVRECIACLTPPPPKPAPAATTAKASAAGKIQNPKSKI